MKKTLLAIFAIMGTAMAAEAAHVINGVSVDDFKMERNGGYMVVDIDMNLSGLAVDGNRAVLLTPRIVNGGDSLDLPSVGIYGRRRYYFYVRNGQSMLSGKDERSFKASEKPDKIEYQEIVPYAEWMNGAGLSIHRSDYGCCNTLLAMQDGDLGRYVEPVPFVPDLLYVRPQAETAKHRSLEGSAFIDFPVNKTVIHPDYRRNAEELGKIQATIDSVRGDRDMTITSIWMKGYASPESPYSHNRDLAIGRTEALKRYVQQLYSFGDGIISTDYEPEDWAGLRRYVEQTNLEHRSEILAIIDGDLEPDPKEMKIKSTYPEEYRFLLQNCYPALRHTDYRIAYDIRSYTDVEEIKRILRERPQKLSLNEFYLVAQEYEPGSDDFNDVFETAVRMFPDDKTANLNAANTAMQRKDFTSAKRYLDKAGDSPEATYARGVYAYLTEDYDRAEAYFTKAEKAGVTQARDALTGTTTNRNK